MKAKLVDVSFSAIENTALITLKTDERYSVDKILELNNKIKQSGKEWLTVDIRAYKSKRSIEQNKLMWELLDTLSLKVHGRKDSELVWETYCEMLSRFGQKSFYLEGLPETQKLLQSQFRATRVIEKRESNGKETYMYQCFLGSSHFNTAEMTAFIDSIIGELREFGVEM